MSKIHNSLFTIPPSKIPQLYSISLYNLLLTTPNIAKHNKLFLKIQEALRLYNLQIAPKEIQKDFPILYLETILKQHKIRPHNLQIKRPSQNLK